MLETGDSQQIWNRPEGLIRRAWKKGPQKTITDQLTGRVRAPAAAFDAREKDKALSINVESSVIAADLDPATFSIDPLRQYAARITVGDCHDNELTAFRDPILAGNPDNLPENPHHGLICGLVEARTSDPDRYEQLLDALAKASTVMSVAPPSGRMAL